MTPPPRGPGGGGGGGTVDVWEPWAPVVGQRVRFRDSGECPLTSKFMRDGLEGVVYHVEEPLSENGIEPWHRFWVSFDEAETAYCAASELEPAEDATAARAAEDRREGGPQ